METKLKRNFRFSLIIEKNINLPRSFQLVQHSMTHETWNEPVSRDYRSTFPFNSSFCNFFQRRKEHGTKRDRVSSAGNGDNEERRGVGDPRGVKARVWVWRVPRRPSPHQHMVRFMSIPWMHLVWPSFSASFCIYPLFVSASHHFSFTPSFLLLFHTRVEHFLKNRGAYLLI